jgi:hypothetical protein
MNRSHVLSLLVVTAALTLLSACENNNIIGTEDKTTSLQADLAKKSLPQTGEYVVFAWNDLGMHCLNPTYDKAVILPPYNTLWAQVVKKGGEPTIVTSGITVEYRIIGNTYSYGKRQY